MKKKAPRRTKSGGGPPGSTGGDIAATLTGFLGPDCPCAGENPDCARCAGTGALPVLPSSRKENPAVTVNPRAYCELCRCSFSESLNEHSRSVHDSNRPYLLPPPPSDNLDESVRRDLAAMSVPAARDPQRIPASSSGQQGTRNSWGFRGKANGIPG